MPAYDPEKLAAEAFRQALKIPKTFFPVPVREPADATTPCFRDRLSKEECAWALAGALFRTSGEDRYVLTFLTAYVTACRNPTGTGLLEALSKGLGSGPLLPPRSLFAPIGDTVDEIVTGLGRTLLKLRERYDLVLPRELPKAHEIEHARVILLDHVKGLLQSDPKRANVYVDRLQGQFMRLLNTPLRRGASRRPPRT